MSREIYRKLLEVMQKRGGAYAGLDIPEFYDMAEVLFTPDEAEVNNAMSRGPVTAQGVAEILGRNETETGAILEAMADKGLCLAMKVGDTQFYQSTRFMPGILEFQFMTGRTTDREKKLARVIHAYKQAFDAAAGPAPSQFPAVRVITVDRVIEPGNVIHTYDQVQTYIDQHAPISVGTCYCRHAASLRGEDIHDLPLDVCMQFGPTARFAIDRLDARELTKAEAREVLDRAEAVGLIHMSQNVADEIGFLCNCDRWHCVAVKTAMNQPQPGHFFNSGFEPRFDPSLCAACETCIERCPPQALTLGDDDLPVVDLDLCFGCAACATGCPNEAITMTAKPGIEGPPKTPRDLRQALASGSVPAK